MTVISGPPASEAFRFQFVDIHNPLPLGHPDSGRDAAATVAMVDELLDSAHPDDHLAYIETKRLFREHDSLYVPETLPRLEDMHRDVLNWMTELGPDDRERFLRWNLERPEAVQERLEADIDELQEITTVHTAFLTDNGLLRPAANRQMAQTLGRTEYRAFDTFAAGALTARGLYDQDTRRMTLRGSYSGGDAGLDTRALRVQLTHTHESLHGLRFLLGGGLGTILPEAGDPASTQWADEAYVELLAQAAAQQDLHAEPLINADGVPDVRRRLFLTIGRAASPEISMELWRDAYAEPLTASRQPARRELQRRLGDVSLQFAPELQGRNILHAVGEQLEAVPMAAASRIFNEWHQRLTV